MTRKKVHGLHEAAHALVGHAVGFTVNHVEIDPEGASKTDIDRGFDCDEADRLIRDHATTREQIEFFLPLLKRDLAVRVAGIAAEEMSGVFLKDDPENTTDWEVAERLAQIINFGEWKIANGIQPPLPTSRERRTYVDHMLAFVKDLLRNHQTALDNLAGALNESIAISGERTRAMLEEDGVGWSSIGALP